MESLRASFLSLFNEWHLNREVGLSVLNSIQNSLALLQQSPKTSSLDIKVMERLMALSPSSSLHAYCSGRLNREDGESQRAALELQDNYILLQTCVKKAVRLADEMKELASNASQDDDLAPQTQEDVDKAAPNQENGDGRENDEAQSNPSDLELLLMMSAASSAICTESQEVMSRIASSIHLETTPEDMFGYLQMWKLVPFLDESLSLKLVSSLSLGSQ